MVESLNSRLESNKEEEEVKRGKRFDTWCWRGRLEVEVGVGFMVELLSEQGEGGAGFRVSRI